VDRLLAFARQQGIDQLSLSRRAGMSPEALSRLKKGGGCRLTTLLALAHAVGLRQVEFGGQVAQPAAALAARKLSAGRRTSLSATALLRALTKKQPRSGAVRAERRSPARVRSGARKMGLRAHLYGFFEELPIESVHDVILEEGLDYRELCELARELGAEGETVEWLQEMAGHGLASTA